MITMLFALAFSGWVRSMSTLLVVGIMISCICSAVTDFLINFAADADIVNLTHWSMGAFSGSARRDVGISALIVLPAALAVFLLSRPISFVGIAVPHICRVALRSSRPHLMIPASFLCGAVFCTVCDLIARTVFSPTELSVGTVTGAIGAPIVIWLMISRRRGPSKGGKIWTNRIFSSGIRPWAAAGGRCSPTSPSPSKRAGS